MKTILITGGANGLGKGVALHYLKNGERVITISSSTVNGDTFLRHGCIFENGTTGISRSPYFNYS